MRILVDRHSSRSSVALLTPDTPSLPDRDHSERHPDHAAGRPRRRLNYFVERPAVVGAAGETLRKGHAMLTGAATPPLRVLICLFGSFRVLKSGQPIRLRGGCKAEGLLTSLALRDHYRPPGRRC